MADVNVSGYRVMGWKLSVNGNLTDEVSDAASQSHRNHGSII